MTVVTPLLMQWSYHSLALSHRYDTSLEGISSLCCPVSGVNGLVVSLAAQWAHCQVMVCIRLLPLSVSRRCVTLKISVSLCSLATRINKCPDQHEQN